MSFLARETVGFCLNAHAGPTPYPRVSLSSIVGHARGLYGRLWQGAALTTPLVTISYAPVSLGPRYRASARGALPASEGLQWARGGLSPRALLPPPCDAIAQDHAGHPREDGPETETAHAYPRQGRETPDEDQHRDQPLPCPALFPRHPPFLPSLANNPQSSTEVRENRFPAIQPRCVANWGMFGIRVYLVYGIYPDPEHTPCIREASSITNAFYLF
jgi:hypothetical protein